MKTLMLFLIPASTLITSGISYGNNWAAWGIAQGQNWANYGASWAGVTPGNGNDDTSAAFGLNSFEDQEINKELSVYGAATFNNVKAHKSVTIHGTGTINDSTFKNLTVFGTVDAENTSFVKVKLYTTESNFDSCTLGSLTVESKSQKPVIELTDTTITGDVVFIGKKGKLKLSGNSSIEGKVVNGEIIQA
jgi:hypothetical protein